MNWSRLREPRLGVMLHYSAGSYAGTLAWCRDPRAQVSYNWLISNDGKMSVIAPPSERAWHAGVCRPSHAKLRYHDANSAFYGIALALSAGMEASPLAYRMVTSACAGLFLKHGWPLSETWRIVGHNEECWPRGRKVDPTGPDPAKPVLDINRVRQMLGAGTWT